MHGEINIKIKTRIMANIDLYRVRAIIRLSQALQRSDKGNVLIACDVSRLCKSVVVDGYEVSLYLTNIYYVQRRNARCPGCSWISRWGLLMHGY